MCLIGCNQRRDSLYIIIIINEICEAPIYRTEGSAGRFTIAIATRTHLQRERERERDLRTTETEATVTKIDELRTVFGQVGFRAALHDEEESVAVGGRLFQTDGPVNVVFTQGVTNVRGQKQMVSVRLE